jgi:hypothetical protein
MDNTDWLSLPHSWFEFHAENISASLDFISAFHLGPAAALMHPPIPPFLLFLGIPLSAMFP